MSLLRRWAIGKRATAGFGGGLVLLLTLLVLSVTTIRHMTDASHQVNRTHEVRFHLSQLVSGIQDVETGPRGYVLTGQDNFLEPYVSGLTQVERQLAALRSLIANRPAERRALDAIEPLVAARVDISRRTIEVYRLEGSAAAIRLIRGGTGKTLVDEIRRRLEELGDQETRSATERQQESDAAVTATFLTLSLGGAVAVVILLAVLWLLNREAGTRGEAEQAAHQSEDRYRATFEQAAIGFALVAPDGRFLHANQTLCDSLGYLREELLALRFQDITHPADLDADLDLVGQVLAGDIQTYTLEKRYFRNDRSIVWINLTVSLVRDEAHGPRYFVASIEDISVRKRIEEDVRQLNASLEQRVTERTALLEAANKELEAFSYSVSHDLRAPLRSIDGFSRILLTEHAAELPPEAREYLQLVRDSSLQMGRLIADLLAFARLGRQPLQKAQVSTELLVRQCLELLHPETDGRQVAISSGELPACLGDAGLLKLVWTNLLANALKYTRLRAPARIEIGCRRNGEMTFFVRDNGVGFNMAHAGKLFGVFQRLHRAEDYEGTGVALATAQRIVHRHGGRIWAEAEPNKGATFYFTLEPQRLV